MGERTQERLHGSQWFADQGATFGVGNVAILIASDHSRYLVRLQPGESLHTHQGIFTHDSIMRAESGETVVSTQGHVALVLQPSLEDLMRHLRRGSQVIYPKDAAQLVQKMSLRAGSRIIEAGTGSGGLTMALAWAVAPTGKVYTYEMRDDAYRVARNNLERVGLLPYVDMHLRAIEDGFLQTQVDALILDVRGPWEYLDEVRAALRPGGTFAGLLPTTNQVSRLLEGMEETGFADIGVEEVLVRRYKPVPDRLRPEDTMPAHTGYLIHARMLQDVGEAGRWLSKSRQRYLARVEAEERNAAEAERRRVEDGAETRKYPPMPLP
jgi:tRNA (adenine57-N1/adenine58-N1)-methyltransferase